MGGFSLGSDQSNEWDGVASRLKMWVPQLTLERQPHEARNRKDQRRICGDAWAHQWNTCRTTQHCAMPPERSCVRGSDRSFESSRSRSCRCALHTNTRRDGSRNAPRAIRTRLRPEGCCVNPMTQPSGPTLIAGSWPMSSRLFLRRHDFLIDRSANNFPRDTRAKVINRDACCRLDIWGNV